MKDRLVTNGSRLMGFIYDQLFGQTLLIHTPKCGGSYLIKQYGIRKNWRIKSAGHASYRSLNCAPGTKVVGLIREPADWYASYYYFCKQSLAKAPQDERNFPANHPVSIFSANAQSSLATMISNMADQNFARRAMNDGTVANVYGREMNDLFDFMLRTETGFWSWTMIWHFSDRSTSAFRSRDDVLREGERISRRVQFIHQENLDSDAERLLNLEKQAGHKINVSERPENAASSATATALVRQLDGELAAILGDYA